MSVFRFACDFVGGEIVHEGAGEEKARPLQCQMTKRVYVPLPHEHPHHPSPKACRWDVHRQQHDLRDPRGGSDQHRCARAQAPLDWLWEGRRQRTGFPP